MSTPLPQSGDPLALLRPRGKAAAGRAGPPAATAAAAAQQRAAHAAAGGAAAAATHPSGAARSPSFAQLLGRAGEAQPAAGAGPGDPLQPDGTQPPLGTGEDAALAHPDAPQDPAAPLAATALPLPTPAAAPLPPAAAALAGASPASPATDATAQPGADGLASAADARHLPPALAQSRQPLPHGEVRNLPPGAVHRLAQPLNPDQGQAHDLAAPPADGRPERLPADPAAADASSTAQTAQMPAKVPSEIELPRAGDQRPPPTPAPPPDSGTAAGRAWQAIDQVPAARTAAHADHGRLQPASQAAVQPVERAAVAPGTNPAAPALAAAQAAAAGPVRTARASAATEGKPETSIAASASNAGPAGNPVSAVSPRPVLPGTEAMPLPASVTRGASPVPAPPAPDALPAAAPSRTPDGAPEQALPPAAWFVPPAPAALAAAAATPALAPEAQANLAAHLQSPAFAPELGAQLTHFARNGVEHARLALNPAEMGPVTVQIQLDGNNAQVHLSAEHVLTRQALEQAMPQLAGSLREAGLTLSGGGVFEQPRQGRDAPDGQPGRTPLPTRGSAGDEATGVVLGAAPELRRRGVVDLVA